MKALKKRLDAADKLNMYESNLKNMRIEISRVKTQIEALKIEIDADADFTQSDKDFMQTAFNLVNHSKYTDFIDFIQTQLG